MMGVSTRVRFKVRAGIAHPTQCEALTPALHLVRIRLVGLGLGMDRGLF
jgi:hypothetical protein